MKLIRHLLSHLLLIVVIAAIVTAYIYRERLFSSEQVAQIDNAVNVIMFWQEKPVTSETDSETETVVVEEVTETQLQTQDEVVATVDTDTTVLQQEEAVETAETPAAEESEQLIKETTESVMVAEVESEVKTDESAEQVEVEAGDMESSQQEVQAAEEDAAYVATKTTSADNEQLAEQAHSQDQLAIAGTEATLTQTEESKPSELALARLAFQAGDLDKALVHYKQSTENEPDNPNPFGEMGNVYYMQGQWELAGQAYYEAAIRLIKRGDYTQVNYLHRVIQGLDSDSAEKLQQQLPKR